MKGSQNMPETYSNAYSLEKNETLGPETAHQLSLNKELKNKSAFQCSSTCNFKLVLVNFGKEVFIKDPHFRSAKLDQRHSSSCSLVQKEAKSRIGEKEQSFFFNRNDSKITVEIDLVKGLLAEISDSKTTNTGNKQLSTSSSAAYSSSKVHSDNKKILNKKLKSLKALIDIFERTKQGELFEIVNKFDSPIDLNDHFHDLNQVTTLNEGEVKIYFSDASVSLRGPEDNPFYHLKLKSVCHLNDISSKPTFNLNRNNSIHHGVVHKEKFLRKQAKRSSDYRIYFFGSFRVNESNKNFYINLDLKCNTALDYLVFYPY